MWAGRSHCVACQYTLRGYDLVPVFSFLFLKGRCRECKTTLSKHYIVTELFTGCIFLFLAFFYQATFIFVPLQFVFSLLASIFLIAVFVSDFLYQEIPFGMTLFPACLLFLLAFGTHMYDWKNMVLGAIIASGFFLFQYLISRGKWIGFGDVALGILMGIILGWQKTLLALCLAYIVGALFGIIILLTKKAKKDTALAFGTFLSVATFVAMLWGEKIIAWYLHLLYL